MEKQAKTLQELYELHIGKQDYVPLDTKMVCLEDAQQEIQKLKTASILAFAELQDRFNFALSEKKELEGRLKQAQQLAKEFPDEGYDLVDLLDKQRRWHRKLLWVLSGQDKKETNKP